MAELKRVRLNSRENSVSSIEINLNLSFGARKHGDRYYCNVSKGATSETFHFKPIDIHIKKDKISLPDILPFIQEAMATKLKIPIEYNSNIHLLMIPAAEVIQLDSCARPKCFHLLNELNPRKWTLNRSGSFSISIVDKVNMQSNKIFLH